MYIAAISLSNLACNSQTKPKTAGLSISRCINSIEPLEDTRQLCFWNPSTRVGDSNLKTIPGFRDSH